MSREKIKDILSENEKFKLVLEYVTDGIYLTDGKAKTIYVNRAYEEISGVDRCDLLGKDMYRIIEEGYIDSSGSLKAIEEFKEITMNQTLANGNEVLISSNPIKNNSNEIEYIVTVVRNITELNRLEADLRKKEFEIKRLKDIAHRESDIVFKSTKMFETFEFLKNAAKYDSTLLITGETGTGKTLLAQYVHDNSKRKDNDFVKVNCGAIPESLVESELFGYEKGSFTGALDRGKKGLFEKANGGTLFLDEISDLPLEIQPKLLHAIQDKKIRPIGSNSHIDVDVRIITATNKDLEQMVKEKLFREDLYYRLNIIPVEIPPLRERPDDIIILTDFFIEILEEKYNVEIIVDQEIYEVFYNYNWPGNVRELENLVERLFVTCQNNYIEKKHLPSYLHKNNNNENLNLYHIDSLDDAVEQLEVNMIKNALSSTNKAKEAAKILKIHPSTLTRKRQEYRAKGYKI